MYTFVEYSVLVASMMRLSFFLCAIVLASSCGDEGRSSPASIPNRAPVITDPAPLSVREGASNVVSLSGTDADGKRLHSYLDYKSPNQFEFEEQIPRLELKKAS